MKPNIHYLVDSKFYRKDIGNKLDFLLNGGNLEQAIVHTKKEFHNESPILAREGAINHFQSYIDVLYEGLGKKFISDELARVDLQKYFNSGNDVELLGNTPMKFKIGDDLFNGINVYMVVDMPIFNNDKKGDKILIYSIGYLDYPDRVDEDIPVTINGLIKECKYYEQHSYSFNEYYSFVNFDKIGGKIEAILKTPFDWDTFMKKYDGLGLLKKRQPID